MTLSQALAGSFMCYLAIIGAFSLIVSLFRRSASDF